MSMHPRPGSGRSGSPPRGTGWTEVTVSVAGVEDQALHGRKPYAPFMTSDAAAGGPAASCTSPPSAAGDAASRSGCMRTATSPICAPTPRRSPRLPLKRGPRRRRATLYGDDLCAALASVLQRARSRTRRRPTRRSGPAGDSVPHPRRPRRRAVTRDEFRLYELIWQRTVASQMSDADGYDRASIRLAGHDGVRRGSPCSRLSASGKVITFQGFLRAYVEDGDDPERRARRTTPRSRLPNVVAEGDDARRQRCFEASAGTCDVTAGPLHRRRRSSRRWRRLGDRPPVDLCLDHAPPSRTAATSGRRAPRSSRRGRRSL